MDWKSTCRVCLESGDMVSLFDWDENNKQLCDKYAYCCGVEVTKDDPLPKCICLDCVDRLTFAYEFKVQCIASIDTLRECLEEYVNTTVTETPENESQVPEMETITVKQENGIVLQYTLTKTPNCSVVTKAPAPKKRGRPRKYVNEQEPPYYFESENPDDQGEVNSENEALQKLQLKIGGSNHQLAKKQKQDNEKPVLVSEETSKSVSDHLDKTKRKGRPTTKKKYVDDKRFKCETCNAAFATNATLQTHIRRHLGIKPFVCSVCGYACTANLELRRHMMKHTGDRPYKCSMCDRRFGDYGSRQKHERVHTGVRPYKCTVCDKAFNYSYVLSNHMARHTGEKKYSCDECNKRFIKAIELQWHNKRHHKELYEQQVLQAKIKKSRQKIEVTGVCAAVSEQIVDGTGSDEDPEEPMVKLELSSDG